MKEVSEDIRIVYLMIENGSLQECLNEFDKNIDSDDYSVVTACILGILHMTRRFDFFYKKGYDKIVEKYSDHPDRHVQSAISDVEDYIESFLKL